MANSATVLTVLSMSFTLASFAFADRGADFNGDGFDDLAIGVPCERSDEVSCYGMVHVIHGSGTGLSSAGSQVWHQNSAGIPETIETFDFFGDSLAHGDFNNDGFDDLAIGAHGDEIAWGVEGSVHVLYGAADGLTSEGNQFFTQTTPGLVGLPSGQSDFGRVLAAGDCNGDSFDDLVIFANQVQWPDGPNHGDGVLYVLFGGDDGLSADGSQFWHADVDGLEGQSDPQFDENKIDIDETFGISLSIGDFNADGFADLVVGVSETNDPIRHGAINIIYGSPDGFTVAGNQYFDQASSSIPTNPEDGDWFGWATAVGDFDADGFDDLAIGVPGESSGGIAQHGMVQLLRGSAHGLTPLRVWHQDHPGIIGVRESNDFFGSSLAAADFDGDGFDDLVIGIAREDLAGRQDAGSTLVLYGSIEGLASAGNHNLTQSELGAGDQFGSSMAVGDYDGDGLTDLAVGAPSEDLPNSTNAGIVNIFRGRPDGLKVKAWQDWHQNSPGISNNVEHGDNFGHLK